MSTGLMSCVRENTPPLDSEMQAEITTMSLPSEYSGKYPIKFKLLMGGSGVVRMFLMKHMKVLQFVGTQKLCRAAVPLLFEMSTHTHQLGWLVLTVFD